MKAHKRTITCEFVYAEIDYKPLAQLLAERFLQSMEEAKKSDRPQGREDKSNDFRRAYK